MRLCKSERTLPQYGGRVSTTNKQKKVQTYKKWKEKQLHGKFIRKTEETRSEETQEWIRKGFLRNRGLRTFRTCQSTKL